MVTFFNLLSFKMAWAGRDERYEWNNHPPSNQRSNKECGIIYSSFSDDYRKSFKSPIPQLSSIHAWLNEWGFIKVHPVVKVIFILWLSWALSHFVHAPWSTHEAAHTQPSAAAMTHMSNPNETGRSVMWVGLGRVCLCHSCHLLLANALAYLGYFILQVHFHWHLHFWVIDKNIGERILHDRIHLPSRSMELAGFQCYCYGVSSTPLCISRQQYAVVLFKKLAGCSLFSFKLYWKWENAEVY